MTEPVAAPAVDVTTAWPALAASRTIDNAEALKAIADPLRVRLLQLMMVASHRTWSVKEAAAELAQPVTKLYHHVKLLEAADLIADVETRVVSGIVEHRYRASQRSLRFDDSMFGTPEENRHDTVAQVTALIDAVKDDLVDYLYREDADFDRIDVARTTGRLTAEEVASVSKMVEEMIEGFSKNRDDPDRAQLPRTSILFMMNPLGHDPS